MRLKDLENLDRDFLTAEEVSEILDASPQGIRSQAQDDPAKLGFPVIVTGRRVRIPRLGFLHYVKYGLTYVGVEVQR